jgi:hypothetical protein
MLRRTVLAGSVCLALLHAASLARAQGAAPPALAQMRKAVLAASGYADEAVELVAAPHLIAVTIINSRLLAATRAARLNEAHRIAGAVVRSAKDKAEFADVEVVHIDYVRRKGGGHADTIDAFDFRKDPTGTFTFHVS